MSLAINDDHRALSDALRTMERSELVGLDFSVPILEAIERKVAIKSQYVHAFDNRHLAIL